MEKQTAMIPAVWRGCMVLAIVVLVVVVPFVDYRWEYTHAKRFREVSPGRVYRSGQLTADGFKDVVQRYQFRTIINLQDDYPDPDIYLRYFTTRTIKESELCRQMGVRYCFIGPDTLPRRDVPPKQPAAIGQFLTIMDDPTSYPVLLHCKAGLHRTGIMTAIYRMEYEGWSRFQALQELKDNGFGEWPCSSSNDYILDYVLAYHPRSAVTARSDDEPVMR